MARKQRIHFKGAVYHVILTGLDEQPVFKGVADRRAWEAMISDGAERFGHTLHGYCWAKNHVQMAIQIADAPLSKIMQNISFRYTRYANAKHNRQGPLFHGRYKAIVIDPDEYLADLVRYIHNNPLRAGTANNADDAKWTSHAAYMGVADTPDWMTTSTILNQFGKSDKVARRAFGKFVQAGKHEGSRDDLMRGNHGGRLLGNARFCKKALKPPKTTPTVMSVAELVKRVCREEGVKEALLQSESRARRESQLRQLITFLAIELNVGSMSALAQRFNRDLTTMSRNQRYFRDRLANDADLQKRVKRTRRQVLVGL